MTKKEIIKTELQGFIQIPAVNNGQQSIGLSPSLLGYDVPVAIVDLDKLAEFLSKYIDIKID